MKKADYLGSRALKGAMAVVLAVGLCPVAPSIDEAGAEENGAAQLEGASSANTSSPIDAASAVLPGKSDQSSEWQSWGDCEWAVDADGNPVHLPCIDFVRVYTGVSQSCGWLGETSTELSRAEDLHIPTERNRTKNQKQPY